MVCALEYLPPSSQAYVWRPASAMTPCRNTCEWMEGSYEVTMLTRPVALRRNLPQA